MKLINKYFIACFPSNRFYIGMGVCALLFYVAFIFSFLFEIVFATFLIFLGLVAMDFALLFFGNKKVTAQRFTAARWGNGEENQVSIEVHNNFLFSVQIEIIDELPPEFQIRNWRKKLSLQTNQKGKIDFALKPKLRGEYHFGKLHVYVKSSLRLIIRRFSFDEEKMVPVFPAFHLLHHYELYSTTALSNESGNYRFRQLGAGTEFEQIKEYVTGDDIRKLNWKASARKGSLMVNHFMEARSQQVYCIMDMGRLMKMPFGGLTLLDHAINSSLMVSNVCLKKQDRVGFLTFSNEPGDVLAADRKPAQMERILQLLYNQKTKFLESDFEMLHLLIRKKIRSRSLLILFTNFESLTGLQRQLPYLRAMARHHLLLVVFFENTELGKIIKTPAKNVEDIYVKTIAEKFAFEKRLIAGELQKHGILSLLSSPQKLTPDTIKKYLELKEKRAI